MFTDRVVILEPAVVENPNTGEIETDWSLPPTLHPSRGVVQPLSSTEAVLTASTVVSRWRAWLPVSAPLDSAWRIRWEGNDHEIDGVVEVHKLGPRKHHQTVLLKLVS